jgi:hypothetical protein
MKTRARPRELAGGGWLQATLRRGVPAGYCADHADKPHATADEADACWRKYLVEQTLRLDGRTDGPGPCKVCGEMTTATVVINGYPRDWWCDEHRTAERVTQWWNAPKTEAPEGAR